MATLIHVPNKRADSPRWPQRRLWTVKEYYRAADAGVFRPDEKLELINGEVIRKASPQGSKHATSLEYMADAQATAFGSAGHVRHQLPLGLSADSEPEPDIAVIRGQRREYEDHHPGPGDVLLVVEVADKTLAFERGRKAALYAAAGIPEYWVVNLRQQRVEVHRDPVGSTGARCQDVFDRKPGETVSALAAPGVAIPVADLLPASGGS